MNRILSVFCTPEVTMRMAMRMLPILRMMIEGNSWVLQDIMEPAHIQLTILVLEEMERAEEDFTAAAQHSKLLCQQLASCRRMRDISEVVDSIWQLACLILGEERTKGMYRAVMDELVEGSKHACMLQWLTKSDSSGGGELLVVNLRDRCESDVLKVTEGRVLSDEDRDKLRKMMARYDLSSGGVIKSVDDMHQAVVNAFFMMSPKLPHGSGQAVLAQLERELAADSASVESLLPVTLEECEGWIDGLLLAAAQNQDRTTSVTPLGWLRDSVAAFRDSGKPRIRQLAEGKQLLSDDDRYKLRRTLMQFDISSTGSIESPDLIVQAMVNALYALHSGVSHASGQALLAQLDRELADDRPSVESLFPVTLEECEGWIDGLLLAAALNEDPNIWGHRLWDTITSHNVRVNTPWLEDVESCESVDSKFVVG